MLTVRPDEWYNAEAVERSIAVLTDALGNRGYAFVEIRPEITRNRDAHTVDIVFRVQEGPRVYVERIDITGNIRTLDKVIRREFRLVEGDPFNTTRMQRSKERIQNLGFFKKVDVTNVPGSAPDRTVIVVDVEEQSTGELSLGLRFFHLRRPARRCSRTRAKFFGSRPGPEAWYRALVPLATGRYQLYGTVFSRQEYRGRCRSVRNQDQPDQQFLLGRHAGVSTDLLWRLAACGLSDHRKSASDLEIYRPHRQYHRCCERRLAVHSASGWQAFDIGIGQVLLYDRRDNRIDPTDGYFASIGNDFAGVGFGVQYLRNKANVGYYYSFTPQWVLSVTGEAGYIFGWGGDPVFLQDSFFVGGDNLRGFERRVRSPRHCVGRPLGGKKYYIGTVSLDVPLGLPKELGLSGRVFSDFGTLWSNDMKNQTLHSAQLAANGGVAPIVKDTAALRASAGSGSPGNRRSGRSASMWPIRSRRTFDKTQIFHVSFGTRF